MKYKKEKISKKALIHSSLGTFTFGKRLKSGGHGEENIQALKKIRSRI